MSFLDELYYGNINPNENRNRKKLPYEKALKTFSDIESKLTKELNGENLKLFNELVNASDEISATSGVENFKIGFRLGVLMMCDSLFSDNSIILKDQIITEVFYNEEINHIHHINRISFNKVFFCKRCRSAVRIDTLQCHK